MLFRSWLSVLLVVWLATAPIASHTTSSTAPIRIATSERYVPLDGSSAYYLGTRGQRRARRPGTDQPAPTPERWRARQISPTNSRLIGEKTALVAVDVALIRNAMRKITAAAKPSMAESFRSMTQE